MSHESNHEFNRVTWMLLTDIGDKIYCYQVSKIAKKDSATNTLKLPLSFKSSIFVVTTIVQGRILAMNGEKRRTKDFLGLSAPISDLNWVQNFSLKSQFYNFDETIWWISRETKCDSRELCIFNSGWSHFYTRLSLDPVQPRTILSNPIQTFSISFVRICSWTFKRPRKVFLSSGVTVKIG